VWSSYYAIKPLDGLLQTQQLVITASLLLPKNPVPALGLLGFVAIIPVFSDSLNIHNKKQKKEKKRRKEKTMTKIS